VSVPKSLVLITVDCLRADHTGFMGYSRPTTPFLDRVAAESMVFPKAVAAGVPTYYSFPGIMASRWPLALGRGMTGLAPGEPTLATMLQQSGYHTAAYIAGNPYLSRRFGYSQGFEVFQDFLSDELPQSDEAQTTESIARTRSNRFIARVAHRSKMLGTLYDEIYFQYLQRVVAHRAESWEALRRYPSADVLVDQACEWLGSVGKRPFFLWLHFMDPHAPYYPPAKALLAMSEESIDPERGRYLNAAWTRSDLGADGLRRFRNEIIRLHDAGVRWVDTQLARLVEALREQSQWDSSVFVLTADHGEEFLDHGRRFHFPSQAYQELLHVPLLVRVPGLQKTQLSDAPFSHIHLAPTVLEAMGIDAPPEFEGRSYFSETQRGGGWEWAISESVGQCTNPMELGTRLHGRVLVVQERRYKLVLDFDRGTEDLFDLKHDPGELGALSREAEKATRARLLRMALRHLDRGSAGHRELAMRAALHEIGLEWKHSRMSSESLAS
jgi:arylsulfatase A-like enzyme